MKKKSKVSDKHISDPNSEFRIPQSELRKRAENKLRKQTAEKQEMSLKDAQPVIHELQVHQIELEMQNEELRNAQIQLEESRNKYSDLYDFAPVGYYTFDKKGIILEVNLTGAALLGSEKSALMKQPFSRFIHREDQDVFYLHLREVLEIKSKRTCEINLKTNDKSVFIAQLLSMPVKDIEGTYSMIRTAITNITERKKSEAAVLESKQINELLLNSIPHPTMLIRTDRTILAANKIAREVGAIVGQYCWQAFSRSEYIPEEAILYLKEHNGVPSSAGIKCSFCLADELVTSGQPANCEVNAFGKIWDTWWVPVKDNIYLHYAIDITERKLIENELSRSREKLEERVIERTAALRQSNELLENIFSNVHVLIVYMDTDFNFIRVNIKYAKSEGNGPEFYRGKNYFDLYPNEENEAIFRKVIGTGNPYFAKARPAEHAELGLTYQDWSLKPVKEEDGRISGLVLSLIDVTDNIVLYSELIRSEHLASVGKLAAGVAHEVNNPINGIINYAQILLNKLDTGSKEYEIASRIIKESDRIAGIVSGLLSFARESREGKRIVHISEIMSDSLTLTGSQLKKDGIKLTINIAPSLPGINAQPQHIEQVFLNLISNACYALNRKYPEAHNDKILRIFAETVLAGDTQHVRITFYDQGAGIPAGILDKIMDPFFTTKSGEGTGLGLSISHGIIREHGGRISIDSVEGKYTKVVMDLPVQK